jgi:tRNA N6-adenosine threonylcarbamoyltransferase
MIILGIESSCDDTSAAVLKDGKEILSNIVSSQTDFHKKYGGVVPEIASRKHLENIQPVIKESIDVAGIKLSDIDGIAVTQGPGLVGSLLVGINFAKAFAYTLKLPLVGINHLEGHLLSPFLDHNAVFPNVTLIVSGGHTSLYYVSGFDKYKLLGRTRDDAAGEAFDKVAKLLGLGYPGGVIIDKLSKKGNPAAIPFPRPMLHDGSFDFSFSGLKTAVLYYVMQISENTLTDEAINDIVASFQEAVVDILVKKTVSAALKHHVQAIAVSGGVASNSLLRCKMKTSADAKKIAVLVPSPAFCTDNAAMIALAGEHRIKNVSGFPFSMNAISRWPL